MVQGKVIKHLDKRKFVIEAPEEEKVKFRKERLAQILQEALNKLNALALNK